MDLIISFIKLFVWLVYLVWPLLFLLCAVVVCLGQIVAHIEKWRRYDGLYWSLITATTVGYGDLRPISRRSKALSVFIAIVGMMFTGIIIAITLQAATIYLESHIDETMIEWLR